MGVGVGKQSREVARLPGTPTPPHTPPHWPMSIDGLLSASPHSARPWDRHA